MHIIRTPFPAHTPIFVVRRCDRERNDVSRCTEMAVANEQLGWKYTRVSSAGIDGRWFQRREGKASAHGVGRGRNQRDDNRYYRVGSSRRAFSDLRGGNSRGFYLRRGQSRLACRQFNRDDVFGVLFILQFDRAGSIWLVSTKRKSIRNASCLRFARKLCPVRVPLISTFSGRQVEVLALIRE